MDPILAAWDLLSRPDGISVRRLIREYARRHGPRPTLFAEICELSWFEVFVPHREALGSLRVRSPGSVHTASSVGQSVADIG